MTNDRIEIAIRLAREDGETIRKDLAGLQANLGSPEDGFLVVDGSAYSPSWRAMPGGAEVWELSGASCFSDVEWTDASADLQMAYEETLDRLTDELGLYWEDGCLWREEEEEEESPAQRAARRGMIVSDRIAKAMDLTSE